MLLASEVHPVRTSAASVSIVTALEILLCILIIFYPISAFINLLWHVGRKRTLYKKLLFPLLRKQFLCLFHIPIILSRLETLGVSDIIVDPGFGFAKTVEQNYELMRNLEIMENLLGLPLLVGISRKSMLTRPLGIKPDEALNATTVMNVIALSKGASILRVHDVKEERQALVLTGLVTKQYS